MEYNEYIMSSPRQYHIQQQLRCFCQNIFVNTHTQTNKQTNKHTHTDKQTKKIQL